jgi:outer membrane protein OmpA-like peptidoglycan-associated protein
MATQARSFFVRSSRRSMVRGFSTMAAAFALLAAADAQADSVPRIPEANGTGADLHLFRPAVDSRGFFAVNGADVMPHNTISFGLVLDYGRHLMEVNTGHGGDYMVEHALQGTFHFDYGLFDRLVLGISAPLVLNWGEGLTDIGPGGGANYDDDDGLTAQALGNLALHAKLKILPPTAPIGIALIVQGGYGVGGTRNFGSEPGYFYWPQLALEKQIGTKTSVNLGLNVGFRGHTGDNPVFGAGADGRSQLVNGAFQYGDLVTGGFGASVRLFDKFDLTAETYGTYLLGGASVDKQRISAEALGGFKVFVQKASFLYLAAGAGYTPGFQAAGQRMVLGFVFEPFEEDRDKDGIPDNVDQCPDEPEDKDGDEDTDGCPEELEEETPVVRSGDRDGDGIVDAEDGCPDKAEDKDGFEDKDGCPEPDNDKDGIPDDVDQCRDVAEDKDGFKDEDGCPEDDNDADGIPDAKDACKNEPETYNGTKDEDGCPDKGSVVIEENNVLILEKILFKTGSAEILPQSMPIVEAVATTLTHHPEFKMIEVQGHADVRGSEQMNLSLTQTRAQSVVDALVARGVPKERVRAMGFGPYCPIDPAKNAAAYEKNRRVEFKIVRTTQGPTGVELGCAAARAKGVSSPPP